MSRRRLAYLVIALTSLGFAACSADATGPQQNANIAADSGCSRQIVGGSSTRC
jgi:hypothetical protein